MKPKHEHSVPGTSSSVPSYSDSVHVLKKKRPINITFVLGTSPRKTSKWKTVSSLYVITTPCGCCYQRDSRGSGCSLETAQMPDERGMNRVLTWLYRNPSPQRLSGSRKRKSARYKFSLLRILSSVVFGNKLEAVYVKLPRARQSQVSQGLQVHKN